MRAPQPLQKAILPLTRIEERTDTRLHQSVMSVFKLYIAPSLQVMRLGGYVGTL